MTLFQRMVLGFLLLMKTSSVFALKEDWDFSLFFPALERAGMQEHDSFFSLSYQESGIVSLDALFFQDQQRWMIWINGQPYCRDDLKHGLAVKNINAGFVDFEWVYGGRRHAFRLHPQQSYCANTGKITEKTLLLNLHNGKESFASTSHQEEETGLQGERP